VDRLRREQDMVHASVNARQVHLVLVEDEVVFRVFHRVILTTYQFERTVFAAYLSIKGIPWECCTAVRCDRTSSKSDIRGLISFVSKYDKKFPPKSLSSTWYKAAGKKEHALLSNALRSIGDATGCKGKPWLFGYTLPEGSLGTRSKGGVQPRGYPHTKCMVGVDGKDIEGTKDKIRSGHIPCNARASNDWAHKTVMVHAFNRFPLPDVSGFLDAYGVEYSPERFALNEMLQLLWRSAVRNWQPVHVAILSQRMRNLFTGWLEENSVRTEYEQNSLATRLTLRTA
jgi:hypothetical protein